MPKSLDLHNAEIRTASVEVRALTISGKQVTLAVFRQLREEPLLTDAAVVKGEPWGTVNYHPDKCGDEPHHLHVVWQRGNDLLRARVNQPARAWHRCPEADVFADAAIREGIRENRRQPWGVDYWNVSSGLMAMDRTSGAQFLYDGVAFSAKISESAYFIAHQPGDRSPTLRRTDVNAVDVLPHLPVEQYRATWSELQELPQLFIAV